MSCSPSVPSPTDSSVTRAFVRSDTVETRLSIASSLPLLRTRIVIDGVKARAVSASERSFWSRSEDSSCGVT